MALKNKGIILGLLIIIIASVFIGMRVFKKTNPVNLENIKKDEVSTIDIKDLNKYTAEKNPRIPEYTLPLKTSDIVNLKDIQSIANISKSASALLIKNGFVVVPNTVFKDIKLGEALETRMSSYFEGYYGYLHDTVDQFTKYNDNYEIAPIATKHLPMFISADSVLHYFHLMFDTTLIKLETNVFYDYLWTISKGLFDKSVVEYNTTKDPIVKEAAKRNVAYFSAALNLLGSGTQTSSIYDNPLYKEGYPTHAIANCGDCIRDLETGKYSQIYECLENPFGFNDTYIVDGKVSTDYSKGMQSETNANRIIVACFKQEGLKDDIKMKEIENCCEEKVTAYVQNNNPMELIGKSNKYVFSTPSFVKDIVGEELANIEKHNG